MKENNAKKNKSQSKSTKQVKAKKEVKKETKISNKSKSKKHNTEKKQLTIENIKILVCIMFAFYACVICYKTYNKNINNNNESIINKTIDSKTISTLVSYIPYYTFTSGVYKDAYNGTKITEADIEDTLIAKSIFGRYSESYTSKNGNTKDIINLLRKNNLSDKEIVYYKSDINNYLTKRYNIDLSMLSKLSTTITNLNKKYLAVNIKSTLMPVRNKVTINYIVYKEKEDIIILEKAIFYELNKNDNKYYIYANSNIENNPKSIQTYDLINELGESININEVIKNDLIDYKPMFKHTFKKNGTGYYWYSTELLP